MFPRGPPRCIPRCPMRSMPSRIATRTCSRCVASSESYTLNHAVRTSCREASPSARICSRSWSRSCANALRSAPGLSISVRSLVRVSSPFARSALNASRCAACAFCHSASCCGLRLSCLCRRPKPCTPSWPAAPWPSGSSARATPAPRIPAARIAIMGTICRFALMSLSFKRGCDGTMVAQSRFPTVAGTGRIVANCFPPGRESMQIERAPLEGVDGHVLEDVLVGRLEHDLWRPARLVGLDPAEHVQAPAVAGLQSLEAHLRPRRGEVVAALAAELQELPGHLDAHQVRHALRAVGGAAAIAEETGERSVAAGEERAAEDVLFLGKDRAHDASLSKKSKAYPSLKGRLSSLLGCFLGFGLRRRLDGNGDRFGVGDPDVVADLHDLELLWIPYVERNRVAPRALERDGARLRVDGGDLRDGRHFPPCRGAGTHARPGGRRRTLLDDPGGTAFHLLQFEREGLQVAHEQVIADLDLREVLHLVAGHDVDDLALGPFQRDRPRRLVDRKHQRRDLHGTHHSRLAGLARHDAAALDVGLLGGGGDGRPGNQGRCENQGFTHVSFSYSDERLSRRGFYRSAGNAASLRGPEHLSITAFRPPPEVRRPDLLEPGLERGARSEERSV